MSAAVEGGGLWDAIVVGAGLFGQTIAAALRARGDSVLVVDAGREGAGSRPSGGVIKPSWFIDALPRREFERALGLLSELWPVSEVEFRIGVGPVAKRESLYVLDTRAVLGAGPVREAAAVRVGPGEVVLNDRPSEPERARHVVVAAGVWTGELVDVPGLVGKAGASFTWLGAQLDEAFVRPWAPYRQVVAFNITRDHVWAGDGSAILAPKWTPEREAASRERCARAVDLPARQARRHWGIRPFLPGRKVTRLERTGEGVWYATGGGKTGALGAAHCAAQALEALT